jgi:two-component system, OmpR family, sensor histidine kinase PrrB
MRLATRFALACAVTVAVLVLLAGLALVRLVRVDVRNDLDAQLRTQATRMRPVAVRLLAQPGPPAAPAGLTPPTDGGIALHGNGGWTVVGAHPPVDLLPATGTGAKTVLADGTLWRAVVINVPAAQGRGRLWVFAPPGEPGRQLDRLRLRVWLVTLLAVPIAGLAGWLVGRAATRPLRRLRHRLASASAGRRLGAGSGVPEIDEVAAVVDTTLDRYDGQVALTNQALQAARSFAAAAAHELRTPLAGIGTNLEVLQRHDGIDPAERDEILADLVAEHRRAVGLLAMLRTLAQGELITPEQFERVDLSELVDAAVDAARRRHPDADVIVRSPPSVPVSGWPDGLRCVLDNLLDNAAVHGRDGADGRARIRVALTAGPVVLSVEDDGPGVPVRHRDEVFQRFAKSPGSTGSGLGLALVAQQVALHRGTIEVGPPPGGAFRVSLPQMPT